MNISQLFVTRRPIAWTAMISVLVWGVYAYLMMPQRQDPIIPVVTGVIITPYPGAEAEKVEQEVTRKIERKVAENPAVARPPRTITGRVTKVYSCAISRTISSSDSSRSCKPIARYFMARFENSFSTPPTLAASARTSSSESGCSFRLR